MAEKNIIIEMVAVQVPWDMMGKCVESRWQWWQGCIDVYITSAILNIYSSGGTRN